MGDMRKMFDELREDRRDRRSDRRYENMATLRSSGLNWKSDAAGECFMLRGGPIDVDFYPSSGRWRSKGDNKTKSGGAAAMLAWLERRGLNGDSR